MSNPSRMRVGLSSDGVLTLAADAPLVSANFVCLRCIAAARAFMRETKASIEPASQRARVSARLLADGINMPCRTWNSVSCSPVSTLTTDCSLFRSVW